VVGTGISLLPGRELRLGCVGKDYLFFRCLGFDGSGSWLGGDSDGWGKCAGSGG